MPVPRKPKPWRGFPSVNAVHGIRARIRGSNDTADPARGEKKFGATFGSTGAVPMGTIPAGALITAIYRNVEAVFAGASMSIGVAAGGATISTSAAISSLASGELAIVAGYPMPTVDTEIWATALVANPATGTVDILTQFYVNKD